MKAENKINFVARSPIAYKPRSLSLAPASQSSASLSARSTVAFSPLSASRRVFLARRGNSGGFIFRGKSQRVWITPVIARYAEYNVSSTKETESALPSDSCVHAVKVVHFLYTIARASLHFASSLWAKRIRK